MTSVPPASAPPEGAPPPPPELPTPGYTRYLLTMIGLVLLLSTVDRYIVSIVADDFKADLGLTDRQLGYILGPSFTIVYALSVFPIARWADRGPRRSIMALGLAVWSGFTVLTAFVNSFAALFVMRMGVGLGEASASPAAQSLISDSVPLERRSRGLSSLSIGALFGLAIGLAGGGWISEHWDWRTAFVVAGVPGFFVALVFRYTIREPRRGAVEGRMDVGLESGTWWEDVRYLVSLPSMRWLLLAHAFALFYTTGKGMWEPTFIRRVYDMGPSAAGAWYVVTTPLPSMIGIFLGGWLCDRWSRRDERAHLWVPIISTLGATPFLLAFVLWPETHRWQLPGGLPAMPVAFLFSIVASIVGAMHSAPFLAAVQGLARLRMRASAAALFSLTGSGLGSGIGPLVVGELNMFFEEVHGDEGVRWALAWITIGFVLTAAASWRAARTFRADLARSRHEGSSAGG